MLNQRGRLITYAPRILNAAERNYCITEVVYSANIWALNKFRCYFKERPVKVITDDSGLTKLMNRKALSSRMVSWSLLEYNTDIEHKAENQNVIAEFFVS